MIISVAVGIAVALAVALLLGGLSRALESSGSLEQRIEDWVSGESWDDSGLAQEEVDSFLGRVEESVGRQGVAASMKEDLARADLTLTVTEYLLIRTALVVLFGGLGFLLQRNLLVALIMAVLGLFLPTLYIRSRQSGRLKKFDSQLPDVLDHLQGSLRAGYGLLQAVEWVSKQLPDPAGAEFDRVIREVQLGRGLMDALESMVRRIPSDDLALIITAIKIQYEVGGSLAEILEIVAHTIRERVRIMREIQVLTAQQRYSGYVLMLLPVGLAAFLMVVNPEYEMLLFTPGPTLCIPIGAVVLMVMGYFIMRRIVDIEV